MTPIHQRYPEYKALQLEWLHEVPTDWAVTTLKRVSSVDLGKMLQPKQRLTDDEHLPYLRAANIQWDGVDTSNIKRMWFSEREREALRLKEGDLLVSEGGDIGRCSVWRGEIPECYFQNSINRVRSLIGYENQFLYYWLAFAKECGYLDAICRKSTIAHLTAEKLERVPVPFLRRREQVQIAKFLDYETAKIDALIENQQQLITLLKEKRQAVISHAVTKGLNPDAPLRDSGVEWLGEVPAHWEVKRLKHLFSEPLRNGVSPQAAEVGGCLTFSIAAVRDGVVDIQSHLKHADISASKARPYRVLRGDVMMMRGNGSRDLVGSVGIVASVPTDMCIYPDILIRLRFSEQVDARLAVLFLNSSASRPQVAMGAKTAAGIWKVSGATVAEFTMPIPPSEEQTTILEYLALSTNNIDDTLDLAADQVALLRERRTALISAAVTGKIDVRNWKAPEPESEAA